MQLVQKAGYLTYITYIQDFIKVSDIEHVSICLLRGNVSQPHNPLMHMYRNVLFCLQIGLESKQ